MAGPTISADLWNASTSTLQIAWSATITSVAGGAADIQLTDAAGLLWSGPGTLTGSYVLTRDYTNAAGTPGTYDIIAAGFVSAGGNSLAIVDQVFSLALDHAAPYTRTDVLALNTAITNLLNGGLTLGGYSTLQQADIAALQGHLVGTSGKLILAPRFATQASALLDTLTTYYQSSKDAESLATLLRASSALRAAMPTGGQPFPFAITSAGT